MNYNANWRIAVVVGMFSLPTYLNIKIITAKEHEHLTIFVFDVLNRSAKQKKNTVMKCFKSVNYTHLLLLMLGNRMIRIFGIA